MPFYSFIWISGRSVGCVQAEDALQAAPALIHTVKTQYGIGAELTLASDARSRALLVLGPNSTPIGEIRETGRPLPEAA